MSNQSGPINHLKARLTDSAHTESNAEAQSSVEELGIEEWLYRTLTRKPYRKWRITPEAEQIIREAIHLRVAENKPLLFRFPFGGYKLWRLPSTPEVDWAEFFMLSYYSEFLAPIAQTYKPGIEFTFSVDAVILERMDNVPRRDSDVYFTSFKKLLDILRPHWPPNFKIDIIRIQDLYSNESDLMADVEAQIPRFQAEYTAMDSAERVKHVASSELNIQWSGAQDWTKLSEAEKQAKIELGPIMHDAYCWIPKRQAFNRGPGTILLFTTGIRNAIPLGTTKTSVTKFWTGTGVLEERPDGFRDRILSPQQLEQVRSMDIQEVAVDIIPLRNFSKIRIYPELRFS